MTMKWTKDGSFPQEMTDRRRIFRDEEGFSYTNVVGDDPLPESMFGYEEAPPEPEYNPGTQRLDWDGSNWVVVDLPPPPEPPHVPVRVTKADFRRLLTQAEQAAIEIKLKEIDEMSATQFSGDQAAQGFQVMMKAFEEPLEFIELDHPDTIFAVTNIMIPSLGMDPSRAEQILSNTPPA